ncbi:hypothetical protein RHK62_10950 [Thermosynechococcus sp. HY213]|uniref:hypothetical protein n=1 Tax=unclassified Thermosynechococcus TaxID=2622553 RepID=UPI00198006A6|nr:MULTISPECIES: hypothetical protein [unclassified Thermosynechococcus]MDR7922697.1 hypothetical protein [Thermosynechococcus sp. HY213]QSF48540.1 hypothetical protein JW907_09295 [Thermosynechococcus sp. TA-1]WNC52044.1 hypothetical protein RHJ02_09300 [Thermosynechococcus sp. TG215]WNC57127.1 hypothetical protein RHJ13_09325 [Thermosynechococcus sp. TG218]
MRTLSPPKSCGRWLSAVGAIALLGLQPLKTAANTSAEDLPPAVAEAIALPVNEKQVVVSEQPSAVGLTVPSLWWAVQQFGDGVIQRWQAFPSITAPGGRVEAFVSPSAWGRLPYLRRFALINQLGNASRSFGYQLILRDRAARPLGDRRQVIYGAYTCQFDALPLEYLPEVTDAAGNPIPFFPPSTELDCQVWVNPNIPVMFPTQELR